MCGLIGHIRPIAPIPASTTYALVIGSWLVSAILFAFLSLRLGKHAGEENDGCLLAISNVLLACLGGALGFLALIRFYPYFLFGAIVGTLLLPTLHTLYFLRKRRR